MGLVYERLNVLLTASCCMLWGSLFTLSYPHVTDVHVLQSLFLIGHLTFGATEVFGNNFIRHLWGRESAPFLQILEAMYGIGGLLGPTVAAPFLTELPVETSNDLKPTSNDTIAGRSHELQLVWPYSIAAGTMLLTAIVLLVVWMISPQTTVHPSREDAALCQASIASVVTYESTDLREEGRPEETIDSQSITKQRKWKNIVIALTLLFVHVTLGLEISFGSFMTTFAVHSDLHLTVVTGAHITLLYWSTFAFFRIVTCSYIQYTGPGRNIAGCLIVLLIANAIFFPFGGNSEIMLWMGSAVYGIALSSLWASVYSYLEQYFLVSSLVSSLFTMSAMVGELVFPAIISSRIEEEADVLMWVTLSCSFLMMMTFCLLSLICRYKLTLIND